MALKKLITPLLLLIYIGACTARVSRVTINTKIAEAIERCTKIAEPLTKNSEKYNIPLTAEDISYMCKVYDGASTCLKNVSTTFLPSSGQSIVDDVLQSSMPLCREDLNYLKTYLSYAPCIKKFVMGTQYCGNHYQYLMDLLKAKKFHDPHMCCANHKFRKCYLENVQECNLQDGQTTQDQNTASEFIVPMMDQSLSAVKQLCNKYVPNADKCHVDSNDLVEDKSKNHTESEADIVPVMNSSNLEADNTINDSQ